MFVLSSEFSTVQVLVELKIFPLYKIAGWLHFRSYKVWLLMEMKAVPEQSVH